MFLGIIIVFLIYLDVLTPMLIFLILVFGIIISLLSKKFSLPIISWLLKRFERKELIKQFPGRGIIFFFVGTLLSLQLFNKDIALASITILSLGDSISHIIGENFGNTNQPLNGNQKKKFEGTIAGIAAGFFGALFFVSPIHAFMGATAGMLAETIQFELNKREVDDNVIVPLVSGTAMFLISKYIL